MPPRAALQLVAVLPEMTLPAIVVDAACRSTTTPKPPLVSAPVPAASTPIQLDCTTLPLVAASVMKMPYCALPEIKFRYALPAPPTVLPDAPAPMPMPTPTLPMAAVPARLVPMRLPWIWLPVEPAPPMLMPSLALPEIRLRAAAVVPPITLLAELSSTMPQALPAAAVPVALVPMKLPSMVLPPPVAR